MLNFSHHNELQASITNYIDLITCSVIYLCKQIRHKVICCAKFLFI